jgi:uncharacterized protein YjbJ (UPF0337 family)
VECTLVAWVLVRKLYKDQFQEIGVTIMGGKADEVKCRIKEAAGALTGNDELREEGKKDQAVGKTKQAVQKVADSIQEAVDKVVGK